MIPAMSPFLRTELENYLGELNALVFSDVERFDALAPQRVAIALLLEVDDDERV